MREEARSAQSASLLPPIGQACSHRFHEASRRIRRVRCLPTELEPARIARRESTIVCQSTRQEIGRPKRTWNRLIAIRESAIACFQVLMTVGAIGYHAKQAHVNTDTASNPRTHGVPQTQQWIG